MSSSVTADLKSFTLQLSQLIPGQRPPALVSVTHVVRESALAVQDVRADKQGHRNRQSFTDSAQRQEVLAIAVIHCNNDGWPSDGVRAKHFDCFSKRNNLVVVPEEL